jgi:hypothetical protein
LSSLRFHTVQSVVTSAILYPFIGENVVLFGLAVIFIDLDHVIEYVRDLKTFKLRGIFPYAKLIEKNLDKNFLVLAMFHTIEFLLLILVLAGIFPIFKYVFFGLVYHICADIRYLKKLRHPFARAYSLIEYVCRSQNKSNIVSVRDLVEVEGLCTDIENYDYWISEWQLDKNTKEGRP